MDSWLRQGKRWDREEDILAMSLYRRVGRLLGPENDEVADLARLLHRSVGSIATKLANLRSAERSGKGGLSHNSTIDRAVWSEFAGRDSQLQEEAERILQSRYSRDPRTEEEQLRADERRILEGKAQPTERLSNIRVRQQSDAFRRIILRNYGNRCSFCDIDVVGLLEVAHIKPWSVDESLRLAPSNGICLCALHHKAFDKGLLGVDKGDRLMASSTLGRSRSAAVERNLLNLDGKLIRLPAESRPSVELLRYHRESVFLG